MPRSTCSRRDDPLAVICARQLIEDITLHTDKVNLAPYILISHLN